MNGNKRIVIIMCIVFFVVIGYFVLKINRKNNNINNNVNNTFEKSDSKIQYIYNEDNYMYEIIDAYTGEVISSTRDENEARMNLEFYKENPDYRIESPVLPYIEE